MFWLYIFQQTWDNCIRLVLKYGFLTNGVCASSVWKELKVACDDSSHNIEKFTESLKVSQ